MNTQHPHLFNWIELSRSAVQHNALQYKTWLGQNTSIAAVIKSNAYGHGLLAMAQLYQACAAIDALCVINLSEAVKVATHGITKPIFVIGYLDMPYHLIVRHDIQVVIYDRAIAEQLNAIAALHQRKIKVHIKFDTGMSRLGITRADIDDFIAYLATLQWIAIVGIFSHLAESYHETPTHEQIAVFDSYQQHRYLTHVSNSHGAITLRGKKTYHFARIGIGLYGYLQKHSTDIQSKLRPVLSLKTKILQIKSVPQGQRIGYDGMFQAPTPMTIATIAMGYHEGIDARLSNKGHVIVDGQFAPIIGRVCMNLTIIDISNIPNCTAGQIVTVIGTQKNASISFYDWSKITQASVYNHLTKLSSELQTIIVP